MRPRSLSLCSRSGGRGEPPSPGRAWFSRLTPEPGEHARGLRWGVALALLWSVTGHAESPRRRPAGASESFAYQRPGPRAKAPAVLAEGLGKAVRLFRAADHWVVRTSDGELWRVVPGGQHVVLVKGVSKEMTLLHVGGVFYGSTPKGLWRLEKNVLKPLFAGKQVSGVILHGDHFYWTDAAQIGGCIKRMAVAGGGVETMATNLGLVDKVMVRKDDYLLGMGGGDGVRGIKRYDPSTKTAKYLFKSRMKTERFVAYAGRTFVHMSQGAGFIKEITGDEMKRLVVVAGGSRALVVHEGSFVWCSGYGVYRMPIQTMQSEALALDTNPRDLVVHAGKVTWIDGWRGRLLELEL